ncbi:ankyrin [Hypoxylon trugodes]|uniref:ankyrin n=1 Tax=Hypoxylon trugodes TaxID=326681 RepID=UPI00219E861A|nr:ankyrin [Hypoxylon trugodes]KAI1387243.1 ankyrin [Hypoxylon trugodes]
MPPTKRPFPDPLGEIWTAANSESSLSTYETKLRELGLRKKLKRDDWAAVYQSHLDRKGKESAVYLNGTNIPWKKAWKEIRRSGALLTERNRDATLPRGVVVRTPSPAGQLVLHSPLVYQNLPSSSHSPLALPHSPPTISQDQGTPVYNKQITVHQFETHQDLSTFIHFLDQVDETMLALLFALRNYRSVLENMPWAVFYRQLLHGIGATVPYRGKEFDDVLFQLSPFSSMSDLEFLAVAGTAFPSSTGCSTLTSPSFEVARNLDVFYVFSRVIYGLSNENYLLRLETGHCPEELEILFDRIPQAIVIGLFHSDLPTMRALWESLVYAAGKWGYKDTFALLIDVGSKHNGWILPYGTDYLSFTAATGAVGIIKTLLKIGARADRHVSYDENSPILEAAVTGNIECIELLLEESDVNRVVGMLDYQNASSFIWVLWTFIYGRLPTCKKRDHIYLSNSFKEIEKTGILELSLSLDNESQSRVLDMLLDNGANVDAAWIFPRDTALLSFYARNYVTEDWRPTVLERAYYWDEGLFRKLLPRSTHSTRRIARPYVCLAAKQGKEALHEYLISQPTKPGFAMRKFLEMVLVEQFLLDDMVLDIKVVQGLIEFGVDPRLASLSLKPNYLPLCLVKKAREYEYNEDFDFTLRLLYQEGAIIDMDVLEAGVEEEGVDILAKLSKYGAEVSRFGAAALSTAARLGNYGAVSWLLDAGVDVNATVSMKDVITNRSESWSVIALASNYVGFSPSRKCRGWIYGSDKRRCGSANREMLNILIGRGAVLKNSPHDKNAFNFMHRLLENSYPDPNLLDNVKFFLELQVDYDDLLGTGKCLLEACLNPMKGGIKIFGFSGFEERQQRHAIFELLIKHGIPIKRTRVLLPCLISQCGKPELIQQLLEEDANINAYCNSGEGCPWRYSPIQAAAYQSNRALVDQLINMGANINQPAHRGCGQAALQAAFLDGLADMEFIQFLLERGADVNVVGRTDLDEFITVLGQAAAYGDLELAFLLVRYGADPNICGDYCALDYAADGGGLDMVHFLLNVGGLSYIRGRTGYDGAIRLAKESRHFAIADLIQQYADDELKRFGTNLAMSREARWDSDDSDYSDSDDYSDIGSDES